MAARQLVNTLQMHAPNVSGETEAALGKAIGGDPVSKTIHTPDGEVLVIHERPSTPSVSMAQTGGDNYAVVAPEGRFTKSMTGVPVTREGGSYTVGPVNEAWI